jgi:putative DNA primase/helicase
MTDIPAPTPEAAKRTISRKWTPKVLEGAKDREPSGPILDPRDPIKSARSFVADAFTTDGQRCLHHHRGEFYKWNGACYRGADNDTIRAGVWGFLDEAERIGSGGELEPFRPTRSRVTDVIDALAAVSNLPGSVEAPTWLAEAGPRPPASEILPVVNGLLHLPSGKIYPPSPLFFGHNAAPLTYDPAARPPCQWFRFLDDLFGEDQEAKDTLQDVFGYSLTPDTSQQKIILVVGPPRSGKGTMARVLTELVGRDNVAAPTLASLSSNFGLAPLIGKPVAIISDARLGTKSDQAAIAERLLSISGEDSLTIDRKFLSACTGRLPTRFLIFTNELPRLSDASGALANRFVVLSMHNSFLGQEDPGLTTRLLLELPGILNWAREGYLRLRHRGYFVQPASAREAIEDLETLGSPVKAFVRERCVIDVTQEISTKSLYSEWTAWCLGGGRQPGTEQTFGRDLKAAFTGLRVSQPRREEGRNRIYNGIGLASAAYGN